MRVVILAAGTGTRLGAATAKTPKPCLEAGGKPLLAYDVAFAKKAGASEIVVVTGHLREVSEPLARKLGATHVLWNARFAGAGNILSLEVARDAGLLGDGFLLMNADHVYKPSIAALVARQAASATHVTAFVDHDRELAADDMKVRLSVDGGAARITAISKTLEEWDAGYVGMTLVPRAAVAAYLRTCDEVRMEKGDSPHVEAVLHRMAAQPEPPLTCDVSGHGWHEIDNEEELARASAALAKDRWYE